MISEKMIVWKRWVNILQALASQSVFIVPL